MEEKIDTLNLLLSKANDEADDKVRQLESVGLDTISLMSELQRVKARSAILERELAKWLGAREMEALMGDFAYASSFPVAFLSPGH